jgi:hypothetical protein
MSIFENPKKVLKKSVYNRNCNDNALKIKKSTFFFVTIKKIIIFAKKDLATFLLPLYGRKWYKKVAKSCSNISL